MVCLLNFGLSIAQDLDSLEINSKHFKNISQN